MTVLTDIDHLRRTLRGWMRPRRVAPGWKLWPARAQLRPVPLGVVGVTITNPGTGYTSMPTFSFSGGGGVATAAQVLVNVTGINLTNAGDGYLSTPTIKISGTGTTATATVSGGAVTGLALTNAGTGYSSLPTVTFSGGGAGAANMVLSAPAIAAGFELLDRSARSAG